MWAEDVANFEPHLRPFQNGQPNSQLYFRLSTTTRLSATNYLLIDAGESTDQRQIEKAPDCNQTPPKLGVVRLQSDAFESELKVRQKERVPSRFNTRLWLYGLHGRVQSEAFQIDLEFN